jgi:hypothetical protein
MIKQSKKREVMKKTLKKSGKGGLGDTNGVTEKTGVPITKPIDPEKIGLPTKSPTPNDFASLAKTDYSAMKKAYPGLGKMVIVK